MSPLDLQLFGVVAVILVLGSLGILRAILERQEREARSLPERMELLGLTDEEALRLVYKILRRKPASEAEDAAQHDLEHK